MCNVYQLFGGLLLYCEKHELFSLDNKCMHSVGFLGRRICLNTCSLFLKLVGFRF